MASDLTKRIIKDSASAGARAGKGDRVASAAKAAGATAAKAAISSVASPAAAKAADVGARAANKAAKAARSAIREDPAKTAKAPDANPISAGSGAGAGPVSPDEPQVPRRGPMSSDGAKVAAGAAAVPAAAGAGQLLWLMALLNWLKTMFLNALAMAMSFLNMIAAALLGAAKAVAGFFTGIGAAVSNFLGGIVSASAATVAAATATVMVGVSAVGGVMSANAGADVARRDGAMVDCAPAVQQAVDATAASALVGDAQTEANAKKVFAVLAGMGMPSENIAGILGNWTIESGVDPTGVETIFDEKFTLGPKKQHAESVDFLIDQYNPSYGARFPAIKYSGIGLGQWTNERNTMLRDYAKSVNQPWHAIETQLGFMVLKDTRTQVIKDMINKPLGSPAKATAYFMSKWEGISDHSSSARVTAANSWYAKMGSWEADQDLADSILSQAGMTSSAAAESAVSNAAMDCRGNGQVGGFAGSNASLAQAIISYAYPTTSQGRGNNGTPLYQELHQYIFPGDPWYMSCDRSVAVAVRWSGTDDTYPPGAVRHQIQYLESSPKWQEVNWGGDKSKLQPGDVLLRYGGGVSHTVMFVGNELINEAFGSKATPNSEIVSGSLNTRSPGAGTWYGELSTYRVWRSLGPEANSKYSSYVPKATTNVVFSNTTPTTTP